MSRLSSAGGCWCLCKGLVGVTGSHESEERHENFTWCLMDALYYMLYIAEFSRFEQTRPVLSVPPMLASPFW